MVSDLARYDEVIHQIYSASLEPARWPSVVAAIAELLDATCGLLFTWRHTTAQGGFNFTYNIPEATFAHYEAKTIHEDPFARAAVEKGLVGEGTAMIDTDLISYEELVATDYYKDMCVPLDIARMCTGVVFDSTDARKLPTQISLHRSLRQPAFTRADADMLGRLLRHLSRSLGVMFHLRDSELRIASSLAALGRLHSGVLLLDATGGILFSNVVADVMFARGDVFRVELAEGKSTRTLRLQDRLHHLEPKLRAAISEAVQPLTLDSEHFSGGVVFPAEDGRPACVAHIAPLADPKYYLSGQPNVKAIAFLYDLEKATALDPGVLTKLFDLTSAEAKAALQVTSVGSIDEMASRIGVTGNTLKTQLKAVYEKTGTHRQADLLKLLLALSSR